MLGDSLNLSTPLSAPAGGDSSTIPLAREPVPVDTPRPAVSPHVLGEPSRPLWVTWFAHPFANWFWFYFGFVAALSGSNMGYPSLGPIVMAGWLTGHLVNSKQPWGELKLFAAALCLGYVCDGLITKCGVLKFHEPVLWGWLVPFWMAMMWPNFAATLNSSMKWLLGRYKIGAVMGAISGPFSYYGGVKWGAVEFGREFWVAMIVIGIEWTFVMPALLWLSAQCVPRAGERQDQRTPP